MATTYFGIIDKGTIGNSRALPNSTFRLHIAGNLSWEAIFPVNFPKELTLRGNNEVVLYLQPFPSPGTIYERELHASRAKSHHGNAVIHLKEGPRFTEIELKTSVPGLIFLLTDFLGQSIPELAG